MPVAKEATIDAVSQCDAGELTYSQIFIKSQTVLHK